MIATAVSWVAVRCKWCCHPRIIGEYDGKGSARFKCRDCGLFTVAEPVLDSR